VVSNSRSRPEARHLKGSDAFCLANGFHGWSEAARDERLLKFVALVKKYSDKGIVFEIDKPAFTAIIKGQHKEPFGNPDLFSFYLALSGILNVCHGNFPRETVDIVFDRSLVHGKFARKHTGTFWSVRPT
jgi:hypothetical protein